ncbi:MAG: segregation/condensation protein A [Planctomycetes bacterium]|nr:segregation/condensation protein A [Planctomycetota bacterium]
MNEYKVALDVYNGPLDLLLFLIRREEIDIYDIPVARITAQYVQYVGLLQQVDPDAVGEFLVLAATLMEIKSRMLLPSPPVEEVAEELVDPRLELVRQLLEYKKFKDAARNLENAAAVHALKHPRRAVVPELGADEYEIESLEIWTLFEAFQRLLEQTGKLGAVHQVSVDDTPIALHADDILDALQAAGGSQNFDEVFRGRNRAEMIGLFLALLELIRQKRIRVTQDRPFAPILVRLLDATPLDAVDDLDYEYRRTQTEEGGDDRAGAPLPAVAADDADGADILDARDAPLDDELPGDEELPAMPDIHEMSDDELDAILEGRSMPPTDPGGNSPPDECRAASQAVEIPNETQ